MNTWEAFDCSERIFFIRMVMPLICKCGNKECVIFDESPNSHRRCPTWPKGIRVSADSFCIEVYESGIACEATLGYIDYNVDWANPAISEELSKLILSKIYKTSEKI